MKYLGNTTDNLAEMNENIMFTYNQQTLSIIRIPGKTFSPNIYWYHLHVYSGHENMLNTHF